jgi:ribosomal protein S18 acetylase RimI-like enzyme
MHTQPYLHPLTNTDFAELLAIERASYPHPWSRRSFIDTLSPDCVCRVAKRSGNPSPLGYLLYGRRNSRFLIVKLAVDPIYRRQGIATELLTELTLRLNAKRPRIDAYLAETNLAGQLFLQASGFQAISLLTAGDPYTGEDLYLLRHSQTKTARTFTVDRVRPASHVRGIIRPPTRVPRGQTSA